MGRQIDCKGHTTWPEICSHTFPFPRRRENKELANHKDRAKDPMFDHDMLKEIRTLMHPLHSPVGNFPVTAVGITATSRKELEMKVKCTTTHGPHSNVALHTPGHQWSRSRMGRLSMQPRPHITYAHAKGCVYSNEPDVVLKSKDVVETMDGYARERLENIKALLEADVDYELGPGFELKVATVEDTDVDGERKFTSDRRESGVRVSDSATTPPCSSSELGSEQNAEMSPEAAARFVLDNAQSEAHALLRAEKIRLEESLATSSLAKGMYFKRCNGEWVNPLGDVLSYGKGHDIAAKVKDGLNEEGIRREERKVARSLGYSLSYGGKGAEERSIKKLKESKYKNLVPRNSNAKEPGYARQDKDDKSALSTNAASNASTTTDITGTTISTTATSVTPELSLEEIHKVLDKVSTTSKRNALVYAALESSSMEGYGYALLSSSSSCRTDPTITAQVEVTPERARHFSGSLTKKSIHSNFPPYSTLYNPERFSGFMFLTRMLMNREELVRLRQCSQEDLVINLLGVQSAC